MRRSGIPRKSRCFHLQQHRNIIPHQLKTNRPMRTYTRRQFTRLAFSALPAAGELGVRLRCGGGCEQGTRGAKQAGSRQGGEG